MVIHGDSTGNLYGDCMVIGDSRCELNRLIRWYGHLGCRNQKFAKQTATAARFLVVRQP